MNECPVLGAVNQLLNGRFWVQFVEVVIQRATRRGAPPPSETWASTSVRTIPGTAKLMSTPSIRSNVGCGPESCFPCLVLSVHQTLPLAIDRRVRRNYLLPAS